MTGKIVLKRTITSISQDKVRINVTFKDGESWTLIDSVIVDFINNTICSNAQIHTIDINFM